MTHPSELFIAQTVADLRKAEFDTSVENNTPFAASLYFSWDEEHGQVVITAQSGSHDLLRADITCSGAPQWFSLNIPLGETQFAAGDVLGVIFDIDSSDAQELSLFVRSAQGVGYIDTHLQDMLILQEGRNICTMLHTIGPSDGLAQGAGYHTLILPLPSGNLKLALKDARLFVLPAERGFQSSPAQLSSFG